MLWPKRKLNPVVSIVGSSQIHFGPTGSHQKVGQLFLRNGLPMANFMVSVGSGRWIVPSHCGTNFNGVGSSVLL